MMTRKEIAKFIDHTLLRSSATPADIKKICDDQKRDCKVY